MTKENLYKSFRMVDGKGSKPRHVIVDESGNIVNKRPSKEELKGLEDERLIVRRIINGKYNDTNSCDNIKEDGKRCGNKLIQGNYPRREYKDGKWTGRWFCKSCYDYDYYRSVLKNDPNNLRKLIGDRRTGNLRVNSSQAKGDKFQELTCRWRCVKDLNVENNNFNYPIDHSRDQELGIIQTKGRWLRVIKSCTTTKGEIKYYEGWGFVFLREIYKEFDNMICYCASKDGKIIERIYILPREEVTNISGVDIYKNPSRGVQWYEKYKINDEELMNKVNEIWREINI